ncbi:MAG: host attachment protein [Gammaproteobacteria bacterium]
MNALIVVADAVHARIFRTRKGLKNLEEQEDFIHMESRRRNRELDSDSAGRTGDQQSTMSRSSTRDNEEHAFARQLGKHVKELYNHDKFDELILIAAPRFLGLLREGLPSPLDRLETRSFSKELIHLSADEIGQYIWNR